MLKFLLILVLLVYTFHKASSFLFKVVLGGSSKSQFQAYKNKKKSANGKVHVDHATSEKKGRKDFQGGEYIDFEEMK